MPRQLDFHDDTALTVAHSESAAGAPFLKITLFLFRFSSRVNPGSSLPRRQALNVRALDVESRLSCVRMPREVHHTLFGELSIGQPAVLQAANVRPTPAFRIRLRASR